MSNKLRTLAQSQFVRSVALVATGTAGAQGVTMLFSPIITRIYGAEAFGLLGTFTAVLAVLMPIAALAYPIAIVLPKNDDDARGIAKLSVYIAASISTFIFVVIFFLGEYMAEWLNLQSISGFLILLPFALFFTALQQVMQQWLIRKKQFKVTARIAVSQSLILNSAKAGFGAFHPVGTVLVILATLGNALYSVQLWFGSRKWSAGDDRIDSAIASKIDLKSLAYKHRDFPFFRTPQQFINALSQSLPVLLLASFFGPASAGFYTLGKTVMGVPSVLIGKAVADVFYPRITEAAHNKENLFKLILKATLALGAVGFVPFTVVIILGPWLFGFIFGAEWVVAGEYARWLAVWMLISFMNKPSVAALATLEQQGFFLFYEIVSIIFRLAALYVGFSIYNDDVVAIAAFSCVGVLLNFLLILATLKKSKGF